MSISGAFSKLTGKPFDPADLKDRAKAPTARRTVGFFAHREFDDEDVLAEPEELVGAVVYLGSAASSSATGHDLDADGGYLV